MTEPSEVAADAASAYTLAGAFYTDRDAWEAVRERVFARSWQWLDDLSAVAQPAHVAPRTLLPGLLDEPLVLARDAAGTLRCLSNVCTHRGALVATRDGAADALRCPYHARRFGLDGRMLHAPGFDGTCGFPAAHDDLPQPAFHAWAGHAFVALDPSMPWARACGDAAAALAPHAPETYVRDPARDRAYDVPGHWALYVENYLEGFHVPTVHPALAREIALSRYRVEVHPRAVLQVAHARGDGPTLPAARCGGEEGVAALYWWIYPNLMLNLYPWGLSLNHVQPLAPDRTRIVCRGYVADPALAGRGAGGALDDVEREDDAIVASVQQGVRARLYRGGRYAARHERGVHHFHRLLGAALSE